MTNMMFFPSANPNQRALKESMIWVCAVSIGLTNLHPTCKGLIFACCYIIYNTYYRLLYTHVYIFAIYSWFGSKKKNDKKLECQTMWISVLKGSTFCGASERVLSFSKVIKQFTYLDSLSQDWNMLAA